MRLQVLAIGRLKAGPEKTLSLDYQTRLETLGRKAGIGRMTVTEFAESQAQTATQRQAEEAKLLSAALAPKAFTLVPVSYTHLRAHETPEQLVCRLLLEKKKKQQLARM